MDNKFTVTFGQLPSSYINREHISENICNDFCLDFPLSHIYILSGVRGSGKTVLLTNVSKNIEKKKDWVLVDVNPNREILEQIASDIYENSHVKHLFLSKSFSFSFHGFVNGDSSTGWHEDENDDTPFVKYLLGTILAAYRDFEDRVNIASKKMTSKEMVMNAVNQKIGKFTKSDIMEYCPEIKSRTIESALKELCDDGILSIERKSRSTFYYRNS